MSDYEDDDISSQFYKPSYVLIAIDTHPSMFIKRGEDEPSTPFKDSLTACYDLANSLIFSQNRRSWSPFAISLARDNEDALVNFNDNILDSIKLLKEKSQLDEGQLLQLYQRKGGYDLSAFFLHCKKLFKEIKSAYYKRTIIYITTHDDPVQGDKNLRFAALNEAKNFQANDIDFQLVTMNESFDFTKFYNELFSVINVKPVENYADDTGGLFEKLSSAILSRYFQRKLGFYPFLGDDERFVKIIQKNFIQKPKLYTNAAVTTDKKPVKKLTKNAGGIKSYTLDKCKSLRFDLQDCIDIKNTNFPIGYTFLYVSERLTDVGFVLNPPAIIDVDPKEDLDFFNSFWQYCVDRKKVLVCLKKTKKLDKIRFVELIPKFANNSRIFLVKSLPFYDEHKLPNQLDVEEVDFNYSPAKLEAVNGLIDALTCDYDPKMFINPSFAKMQAFLRSQLLGEKKSEEIEDISVDREAQDEQLGQIGDTFAHLFNLGIEEKGAKRKSTTQRKGRPKKSK